MMCNQDLHGGPLVTYKYRTVIYQSSNTFGRVHQVLYYMHKITIDCAPEQTWYHWQCQCIFHDRLFTRFSLFSWAMNEVVRIDCA